MNENGTAKILVAGDIMLDIYHYGKVERISPEAPVPVLCEKQNNIKYVSGGAANVAVNLISAGISCVDLYSVVGDDVNGTVLLEELFSKKIGTEFIIKDKTRPTTSKLRYIGQNNQQILRVDDESKQGISKELTEEKQKILSNRIKKYDLIMLSDYLKGFLTVENTRWLIELARQNQIPVFADVKDKDIMKYQGATLLKPNQSELHMLVGKRVDTINEVSLAASSLCREAECDYVLATLGADGMMLTDKNRTLLQIKSTAKEVYDVTGAGDTAIAYLAAEYAKGKSMDQAVITANYAAGIQVSKMGTSIVYPEEIQDAMNKKNSHGKILNSYLPDGIKSILRNKEQGKKIIFTNGCFDILHAGHVDYLRKAKELGDCLVVGVNSDASVRRLKGAERPINEIGDRLLLLSALEFVDYVVAFEEDTPIELIRKINPDVLVKGGDYSIDEIVGADIVKGYGGSVTTISFVDGKSTTNIINKMRE